MNSSSDHLDPLRCTMDRYIKGNTGSGWSVTSLSHSDNTTKFRLICLLGKKEVKENEKQAAGVMSKKKWTRMRGRVKREICGGDQDVMGLRGYWSQGLFLTDGDSQKLDCT